MFFKYLTFYRIMIHTQTVARFTFLPKTLKNHKQNYNNMIKKITQPIPNTTRKRMRVTSKAQYMTSVNCEGRDVSRTSTSLENLDSILPIGVTSKNCNCVLNTFSNNPAWRIFAARQHARYGIKSANIEEIAEKVSTVL